MVSSKRCNAAMMCSVAAAELQFNVGGSSLAELATRGRSEAKLWRSVMDAAGIKPE